MYILFKMKRGIEMLDIKIVNDYNKDLELLGNEFNKEIQSVNKRLEKLKREIEEELKGI